MEYRAIIHEAEEGGYWAEVPELPGCVTEGDTLEEVKANVVDAARGWLEAKFPDLISFAPVRRLRRRGRGSRRREAVEA